MNYTKIILSGSYRETGKQTKGMLSAAGSEGFRFDSFYLKVDRLIRKNNIKKILIICRQDFSAGIFGGLEEVRTRLEALSLSGKELYFYAPAYGAAQLYLASVCTHRLIHPMGTVRFSGLSRTFSFFRNLMRRYGIDAEVIRRGQYKSAGDRFRTDSLADPVREEYGRFTEVVMSVLRDGIIEGFGKKGADLDLMLEGRIFNAAEAVEQSWADRICTDGTLENEWKKDKEKEVKIKKISNRTKRGFRPGAGTVAVLVFEGAVIDGHSKRDPMLGQAIGDASFIPQIRKLTENRNVKAVVLRINSGGGSAFASESITAELRTLAEKKPLIVSMSEVAGSGGYWMSCCGRKTLALSTTLTGSIGVISIYISWYKLMQKLGITHDTIKIGEHADTGSPLRPLTADERRIIDAEIESMYDNFISLVADFRKMSKEEVDSLGQGRVWAGRDAVGNKLVDSSGGLSDAVEAAAAEAGIKRPVVRFYPEIQHSLIERLMMNTSKEDESAAQLLSRGASLNSLLSGNFRNTGWGSSPAAVMEQIFNKWV